MTDSAPMTAMDIIVLLLVGGCLIFGVIRGFVTEVLSLLAWVAAVMALRLFYTPTSEWMIELTGTEAGGAVLAFATLFLGAFVTFRVIGNYLGGRTRQSVVGPIDRLLGGGFGAVKGLIGASLLFLLANLVHEVGWGRAEKQPEWMAAGRTYPLLKLTSRLMVDFVEERRGADDAEAKPSAAPASKSKKRSIDNTPQKAPADGKVQRDKAQQDKASGQHLEEDDGYTPRERRGLDELLDAANALIS